jgi:hypothetical protein
MTMRYIAACLLLFVTCSAHSGLVDPAVDGNEFSARIELGGVSADLTIRFENVVGLTVDSLGVSVQRVDPLDLNLLNRLPSSLDLGIGGVPSGFPVLVRVEPPVDGGLSFEGVVNVELYTQNLQYTIGTPFRIFTAPTGAGTFRDVTEHVSGGSYRTRSGGTHFSDFLILVETRSADTVVAEKFDRLDQVLDQYQSDLDPALYSQLVSLADSAYVAWDSGDSATAILRIDDFRKTVRAAAAAGTIPNVWRSARDLENIDGALRSTARTLRFSLTQSVNLL